MLPFNHQLNPYALEHPDHRAGVRDTFQNKEHEALLSGLERAATTRLIDLAPSNFRSYLKVADRLHKLSKDVDQDGPIVGTFEFLGMLAGGTIGGALGVRGGPVMSRYGAMGGAEAGRATGREIGRAIEPVLLMPDRPEWHDDSYIEIEMFRQIGKGLSYCVEKGCAAFSSFLVEMKSIIQTAESIRAEHPAWSFEYVDLEYFKQLGTKICENWHRVERLEDPGASIEV